MKIEKNICLRYLFHLYTSALLVNRHSLGPRITAICIAVVCAVVGLCVGWTSGQARRQSRHWRHSQPTLPEGPVGGHTVWNVAQYAPLTTVPHTRSWVPQPLLKGSQRETPAVQMIRGSSAPEGPLSTSVNEVCLLMLCLASFACVFMLQ